MSAVAPRSQELRFVIRSADGERVELTSAPEFDEYVVGRKARSGYQDNRIFIKDKYMSRRHCRVYWDESGGWTVEDLKSANGSKIAGKPLSKPTPIVKGTTLRLGRAVLEIEPLGEPEEAPTEVSADPEMETAVSPDAMLTMAAKTRAPDDADEDATRVSDDVDAIGAASTEASATVIPAGATEASVTRATRVDRSDATQVAETIEPKAVPGDAREAPTRAETAAPVRPEKAPDDLPKEGLVADLLESHIIDPWQAHDIITESRETGRTFFRTLVESEGINRFLDEIYGWVANERELEVIEDADSLYDRAAAPDWLSHDRAAQMGAMLLSTREGDQIHYATVDPYDIVARDWLLARTGATETVPSLVRPDVFQSALQRIRNSKRGEDDSAGIAIDIPPEREAEIREHLGEAEAPQIVDYFLHRASLQGASDIHIEPTEESLAVRVRVDGVLHQDITLPAAYHPVIASRLKIMSGMDVAEKRRPQDGRIGLVIRGNPIDVRVSTFPTVYGEKVVMRLLDKTALRPSPDALGLLDRDLRILRDKIHAPYGLVMLCGPTGSGKTTTLYSCLGAVDKVRKNVLTVEDPVEYRLNGVHQMQVNHRIGLTFASGLRTILRQDPDVIMVGEIRDTETAEMAIQASLTGHVVFSTIHTNDATGVVTRLIDMDIEPFLVASSLSVAIAQRLVRELCPSCKTSVSGDEILAALRRDGISDERIQELNLEVDPYLDYAESRGCRHCRDTGYVGRRAVFEVFDCTNEARAFISSKDFRDEGLQELATESGMTTLVSHGLKLVEDEVTTFAEVIRVLGEKH